MLNKNNHIYPWLTKSCPLEKIILLDMSHELGFKHGVIWIARWYKLKKHKKKKKK